MDIWLPILTIAKLADEYEEMVKLAVEKVEEQSTFSEGESFMREITFYLLDEIGENPSKKFELGILAKEYALSVCQSTNEEARDKYASGKQRMFLKMIKNFLRSQPSLWKKEKLSRPHNRETIEINRTDLERVAELRGYKIKEEEPKEQNDLTQFNQLNQANNTSHNLTNRLSQVKSVKLVKSNKGTTKKVEKNKKTVSEPTPTTPKALLEDWKRPAPIEFEFEKCKICGGKAGADNYCNGCRQKAKGVEE